MRARFARLRSRLAIPAWIAFLWTMLAHASTAQFVTSLSGKISEYLDRKPSVGIFLAVAWLVLVIVWPEIRHHIPRLPRTIDERLKELEGAQISVRIEALENGRRDLKNLVGQVVELQKSTQKTTDEAFAASRKYQDMLDRRLETAERQFSRLIDHNQALLAVREALQAIPSLTMYLLDIHKLLDEITSSIEQYSDIRDLYPTSPLPINRFQTGDH